MGGYGIGTGRSDFFFVSLKNPIGLLNCKAFPEAMLWKAVGHVGSIWAIQPAEPAHPGKPYLILPKYYDQPLFGHFP